jgi:lysophospholipase L1-like esterase
VRILLLALLLTGCALPSEPLRWPVGPEGHGDVLLVGDSWAATVSDWSLDGAGLGTFGDVLAEHELLVGVRGANTTWAGRTAEFWAGDLQLDAIVTELTTPPRVDYVHLVVGGNDLLAGAQELDGAIAERDLVAIADAVEDSVELIVETIRQAAPHVHILIADYEFLDTDAAAEVGRPVPGLTLAQTNAELVRLGHRKRAVAERWEGVEYHQNFGRVQRAFLGDAVGPAPGRAPEFDPFPGGDPAFGLPEGAHLGDGVHPNDEAHRVMLEAAVQDWYRPWIEGS